MFTGIVEELGKIKDLKIIPDSAQLTINTKSLLVGTKIGDSIAVNGVCLTVVKMGSDYFTVDVMAETLNKTNLYELNQGSRVNLERALQLHSRLGGHLVSGHVDGTGIISSITPVGIAQVYKIKASPSLLSSILPKGSIAIDGISLTVVDVNTDYFTVSLIPHTFKETTLGIKRIGNKVNLETDLIGKYVFRFLEHSNKGTTKNDISIGFLADNGFL